MNHEVNVRLEPAEQLRKPSRRKRPSALWLAPALCLLFLLGCAAASGVFAPKEDTAPVPQATRAVTFTQLIPAQKGTPVSVNVLSGGEDYTLAAGDDGYVFQGEPGGLDQNAARELLASGAAITSRQTLTGNAEDFGLTEPAATAVYTYADGSTVTLVIGAAVATGEGWYASVDGGETIHIVNNALQRTLTAGRNALYALPDMTERFTANTLLEASIACAGRETVTIARVTEANPFNMVAELTTPIRYPANSERAAEIYLALEALIPTGVAAAEGEDADWGLDDPLAVIRLKDEATTVLTIGLKDGQYTLRIDEDKAVYTVDSSALSFLQSVTVPYLAEQLPGLIALNRVSALEVTSGEEVFSLTMDQAGAAYTLQGQTVEADAFIDLYQQIIALLIERYVTDGNAAAQPRVTFRYTLQDGTAWTLTFAAYNEQFDLTIRDGCASFLISRSKVDAVVDAIRTMSAK